MSLVAASLCASAVFFQRRERFYLPAGLRGCKVGSTERHPESLRPAVLQGSFPNLSGSLPAHALGDEGLRPKSRFGKFCTQENP